MSTRQQNPWAKKHTNISKHDTCNHRTFGGRIVHFLDLCHAEHKDEKLIFAGSKTRAKPQNLRSWTDQEKTMKVPGPSQALAWPPLAISCSVKEPLWHLNPDGITDTLGNIVILLLLSPKSMRNLPEVRISPEPVEFFWCFFRNSQNCSVNVLPESSQFLVCYIVSWRTKCYISVV